MGKGEILVEEEEEEMVAPNGNGLPIRRMGRFLKPRVSSPSEAAGVPLVPSLCDAVSHGFIPWPPKKVVLEGWRSPQPKWKEWVERLKPVYQYQWKKAGIYDAIIASTYEIRRHPSVFFALLLYWCPETNTFVFPWSEATLTLEDVIILGGFPVLGEPIRSNEPLPGELGELVMKMVAERKGFNKLSSKKASHYEWIKHYMEVGKADELEHIAFLSLWLSRFVFPTHPGKTVGENVFPIAIRLARGIRIALAPAVLASLYRDLRVLRDHIVANGADESPPTFIAWAPFQMLQLWAWEHFVALRVDICPNFLQADDPRAARWHGLDAKLELSYVISILESPEEFQWRPYTTHLDDWHPPSFYKDGGQWISISLDKDEDDMRSYARFLRASELLGIDCIEQYLPHRVAMQFGLDQDLPACVPRACATWKVAWETYDKDVEDIHLYAPPRLFESDCTQRFFNWQQECLLAHGKSGENPARLPAQPHQEKHVILHHENQREVDMSLDNKSLKLEDQTDFFSADEMAPDEHSSKLEKGLLHTSPSAVGLGHIQKQQLSKIDRKMSRKRMLSNIYGGKLRHREDALHRIKTVKTRREGEAYMGELFNIEVKGVENDVARKNSIRFYAPKMIDELEGTYLSSYDIFRRKEREEKAARLQKERELDAQIEKIKAEIAELQATVMNMEFKPETT